jgi:hypothetical protein
MTLYINVRLDDAANLNNPDASAARTVLCDAIRALPLVEEAESDSDPDTRLGEVWVTADLEAEASHEDADNIARRIRAMPHVEETNIEGHG